MPSLKRYQREHPPPRANRRRTACSGGMCGAPLRFSAALLAGCLVSESKCVENQEFSDELVRRCVCKVGFVVAPDGDSCIACGENEVAVAGECQCEEGYGRTSADGACEEVAAGTPVLGGRCAADDECFDPYGYCVSAEGDGYCSSTGCSSNADCEAEWTCTEDSDLSFCRRPPTGLGEACGSSDDCRDFEASYCEMVQSKACQEAGCGKGVPCHADWACCDYTAFFGTTLCIPPSGLEAGGECPGGVGKPVAP